MKYRVLPSLIVAAAFTLATGTRSAFADGGTYLNPQEIDLTKLLAPPPASDSVQQKADLARVMEVQRTRTPYQVERAQKDVHTSVFRFADVLGPQFNEANLPKTAALFAAAEQDAALVAKVGKRYFKRARPFVNNSDVHPTVPTNPKGFYGSYPSGHATFGYMAAILLAQMVPEKRAELFARGREFGQNRIVDGVHYPSDITAGQIDGTLVANALMESPKFQQDFAAAKAEMRMALDLN
ncbi:phosphatase PAP2 family protein, partial [Escherichia coli]|nr:phosphatase PAP2 family protein [Escherichia coli]